MFYGIIRVLKFSWESVWRNLWLSIVTVSTIALTLFSISMLVGLQVGINQVVEAAERRIDLSVYFYPEVTEAQAKSVALAVQTLPGITEVVPVTKEEALSRYQEKAKNTPELLGPLSILDDNPFGPSLIVRAEQPEHYTRVIAELDKPQYQDLIEGKRKDFEDNQDFISTFSMFSQRVRLVGLLASGVFAFIAGLLLFNAIRVAIYTHREEIAVMKLVGAGNSFIRAPFLLETTFYCVLATLVAAAGFFAFLYVLQPYLTTYFNGELNVLTFFRENAWIIFPLELAFVLVLSSVGSAIALRRYLRV